jgi:hypothetical protein
MEQRSSRGILHHLRSNAVAYVALFVALGGTGAWAADKITARDIAKNAVRTQHIKKGAVTTPKLADGAVTARKLAAGLGVRGEQGLPGQQGPPGQDATKLFAYISDSTGATTASVQYGSGVTAVDDPPGDNAYTLTFNRSVVNCVVLANPGYGKPAGTSAVQTGIPVVSMDVGGPNQANVFFEKPLGGGVTDTAFLAAAFC